MYLNLRFIFMSYTHRLTNSLSVVGFGSNVYTDLQFMSKGCVPNFITPSPLCFWVILSLPHTDTIPKVHFRTKGGINSSKSRGRIFKLLSLYIVLGKRTNNYILLKSSIRSFGFRPIHYKMSKIQNQKKNL